MTTLATDPLTLVHLAISLLAIVTGLPVLAAMMKGQTPVTLTGVFLGLTVLTSVTPAMIVGAISLIILAVALFALYGKHLAGRWRTAYVITATLALYLNVFVLVIQSFIKIPPLHALAPAIPPAGPVFGAVQGIVLLAFVAAGWMAVKARPAA
jgi:cellulose synthase/poly-beta-1,6-N-acetylglucosamine synthase-like glycosyltransferase